MEFKQFDNDIPKDPVFTDMTAKFNNESVSGLLINILPIDENVDIKIDDGFQKENIFTEKKFHYFEKINKKIYQSAIEKFKSN